MRTGGAGEISPPAHLDCQCSGLRVGPFGLHAPWRIVAPTVRRLVGGVAWRLRHGTRLLWSRDSIVVFGATAADIRPQSPALDDGSQWAIVVRAVGEIDEQTAEGFPAPLRGCLPNSGRDDRLHALYVDGRLAAWGFSAFPAASWRLTETGTTLHLPEAAACLTAFETLAEFRGRRLYPTLLTSMTTELFARGARHAFIWCLRDNLPSRTAIERVGFRYVGEHRRVRVLGIARTQATVGGAPLAGSAR
jgi:hypothetical protein